uniref:MTSS I-BAR domain containing 2a n=1 Tax=Oreochromis niloticus TaxID=8128 RepID=A0A669DPC8_ORENI
MESVEKECGALGGLFQAIVNDMKSSYPVWEDFSAKATKLHSQLRTTILAAVAFLDAFQKVADMATNSRGATRDIGSALTRMCMRHRSIEAKLRHFTNALMEGLVTPLQDRIEEWKKTANQLDKDHAKEYKRSRQEIKRKSLDTIKLQKKARKGRGNLRPQLDSAMQDVSDLYLLMEETEKQAVRRALLEERGRYCSFINLLQPVVNIEIAMLGEITHLQAIVDDLTLLTEDPHKLPPASEQVIRDLKGSDYSWSYQTPPSSPSSTGSRKSSMCRYIIQTHTTSASTLAMVLTRGLSMEQQKSSRDSLQYSSGYSTQTNTPSCSEDTIPSQGSDYECYSLNGDADSEGQVDFDKSSTIPRHSNIAQSYRRMIQTKRPASTAGLPAAIASGTATIRRTPSSKTGVRRTPSTSGPIPIRPPIVPVKTPTVPNSPGYTSPSHHSAGSEEFLYGDDLSASDNMRAPPKRMSLPDTSWGCGRGVDSTVYEQQALGMAVQSVEEDPMLAANRHSLVEKIGELAASAHALGEGQFPFPSSLSGDPAQFAPQGASSVSQEDVDMLVSIRRGVKLRKTVTDDRSAPRILR